MESKPPALSDNLSNCSVYTSLPLKKWYLYKESLLSWASLPIHKTFILCSESEILASNSLVSELSQMNIFCIANHPKPQLTTNGSIKPSFADIFKAIQLTAQPNATSIFLNADITYNSESPALIDYYISLALTLRKAIFFNRWDFLHSVNSNLTPYISGFDLIILPAHSLSLVPHRVLHRFCIGQVGWDYAIPLSLPHNHVARSSSLPVVHRVHPTTSSASWSQAMSTILLSIHYTHIRGNSYYSTIYSLLLILYRLFQLPCLRRLHLLQEGLTWLHSRLSFYLLITHLLRRLSYL